MGNFRKFCEMVVERNGNPSVQDVIDCGYTVEHFIIIAQSRISTEKLLKKAKHYLEKGE